jgi:type III restriction enzyme
MVRETKATRNFFKLRNTEVDKVRCGAQHFKTLGTDFGVVTAAREIFNPERPN